MSSAKRASIALLALFVSVAAPPLIGAVSLAAFPWRYFLELPPHTQYAVHAGASTPALVFFAALGVVSLTGCLFGCGWPIPMARVRPHPWWGPIGPLLLALGWSSAWARGEAVEWFHPYSFTVLWLGYIFTVESILATRGAADLRPVLFLLSAMFWWTFELLNRFVQNWSYPALERFSGAEYVVLATLAFSTVLPAVHGSYRLLACLSRNRSTVQLPLTRRIAAMTLVTSILSLLFVPVYPNELFVLVWVSPLVNGLCLAKLFGLAGEISERRVGTMACWALAALLCGVFWELWNFGSAFKWIYHIPYVEQWHIFEMPLLGFAGYLPFGVLCGLVTEWGVIAASER